MEISTMMRCNICNVLRVSRFWRKLQRGVEKAPPRDVPPGHLAVIVGITSRRRFVIKMSYLNHPIFQELLEQAYLEYGHNHDGPLSIPCDEGFFLEIVQALGDGEKGSSRCRGYRPLVHGFAVRSTW
ncbi:hypothetical protein GIB67_007511 [Kingdonia uniflora]|uniref:Small auxin up regulated protein n=1 Tax=Kingdonia uniflora TaxID=39325 RepID=A0A7J7LW24_9MAGN|nr:hypothetical protein GIB67_007511 [Kingdonia uniflora]